MRNLLGRLHDRAAHELELIASWWEVDLRGRDRAGGAGHLYRVVTDAWSFALAWERLSPTDRVVLELLADDEGAFPVSEIAERLGASRESVQPSVQRLYRAGFLYAEDDDEVARQPGDPHYFLPREIALLTASLHREQERGLPDGEDVADLLERLSDGALADIAEHMGRQIIPALALRADLLAYVQPRLGDPQHLRDAVRSLNPTAARLWRWLTERVEPARPDEAGGALRLTAGGLRQAVQPLAQRGLVWRGYAPDGSLRVVVPELLRQPRRAPESPPPDLVDVAEAEIDPPDWMHPYAAPWDLLTFLRAMASGQLRRPQDYESGAPALRRLTPALWRRSGDVAPTGYVQFLVYLATALGLIDPGGHAVEIGRVREWSALSFPEQTQRLTSVWQRASSWPEGSAREALHVWGADWSGFRTALLAALGELATGRWVTLDSFTARCAARSPGALGPHFTAAASHDEPDPSPERRRAAVLRLAVDITLTTACAWLGLVSITTARRMTVFSLTELGHALVHGQMGPEPDSLGPHPLVVQPDFEVLLLQPSPRRVWALSAFTELIALDRASGYRISRQGIERGLMAGLTVGQITGFLEQQAEEPLPQNVAFEIGEWAREFRRVRTRDALVLEPDARGSAGQLAEVLQADGLRVELLPRDRLLVLAPDGEDAGQWARTIDERLRALGQTPVRRGS